MKKEQENIIDTSGDSEDEYIESRIGKVPH